MSFRGDLETGRKIYTAIEQVGYAHTSTCYAEKIPEKFYSYSQDKRASHYKRVFRELSQADVVVLESSLHSLTIGQFIQKALDQKSLFCFFVGEELGRYFRMALNMKKTGLRSRNTRKTICLKNCVKAFRFLSRQMHIGLRCCCNQIFSNILTRLQPAICLDLNISADSFAQI